MKIRRTPLASPDATRLITALNAELQATFPEPGAIHFSHGDSQIGADEGAFLVAYFDNLAVGCGAVRRLDEATAEIKRMYVDRSVRGQAIGRAYLMPSMVRRTVGKSGSSGATQSIPPIGLNCRLRKEIKV